MPRSWQLGDRPPPVTPLPRATLPPSGARQQPRYRVLDGRHGLDAAQLHRGAGDGAGFGAGLSVVGRAGVANPPGVPTAISDYSPA